MWITTAHKEIQQQQWHFTLDDMNYVLVVANKGSVHASFDAELLLQGLGVTFDQGVVSVAFVDVDLVALQVFDRTK